MEQATINMSGGEPNPLDSTGLCLLSLDGGGVRGLSTLYILKSIMDRLNDDRKRTANLPPVKPCEVFDLIGGTSTGGLIAIMLGRLEMSVDDCITAYGKLAEDVFKEKRSSLPFNIRGKVTARFDSAKLQKAVQDVLGKNGASEEDLLNDGTERGCKTFVCTADRFTKDIIRLRSYILPHEPKIQATICQAALATSAATTFFEPVSIGDRSFADGGLGANNPVDQVEGEASNIWSTDKGDLKPLVKCFISIGTGKPGTEAYKDSMFKFLGQTLVQIATETENTEKRFIERWAGHFDEKRYFRFNVEQGLQGIELDEYKRKGEIEAATEGYITHKSQYFRVRDCIQNLRLKQNNTETSFAALVNEYTTRMIRQQPVTQHTPWIVPFDRNPRFTGRESQLAQLQEKLFAKDTTTRIAITGLGGVGKTQLLLELLYQIRDKRKECSIIWIPATNMESLHQAYLDVAQQLGIPGWEDKEADVKRLVQEYLSKDNTGQWLLVFDNADDIDMWISKPESGAESAQESGGLIDYLPRSKQGNIVFTTRDRKAVDTLAQENVVEVQEMDGKASVLLLQKCLGNPDLVGDGQDAAALLQKLTYLPLAIIQTAAYINKNGITLAEYMSLLGEQEEEVIDLLSEEFQDFGRYRNVKNPVATTWLISFEQIRCRDPLAAEYLSFMCCIDPKDIPQSLLPPGPSRKKEIEAIGTLNAYSFISKRPADQALDLHRLVHLATRNWLGKENLLAHSTEQTIVRLEEVFPDDNDKNRSVWRTYLPHARYVLESNLVDKYWQSRVNLLWRYGTCLNEDGRWNEAEAAITEVLEIEKRNLGADHRDTLTSMGTLASIYWKQGRSDEAEMLELQVMETRKTKLGVNHPDTLTIMNNLALTYKNQGRWEEAEKLQLQVIETRKTKFRVDHPDMLTSMGNLALIYWNQGRSDEAEMLELQVMETRKTKLGVNHPDTLTTMNNLALTYWNQGRLDEAEMLQLQVIETRKTKLGADHPDTLASINNLASIYWNQGRWEEAEMLQLQVMETRKTKFRVDHPDMLTSMGNLALIYWNQGRSDEAEMLELQVMETRKTKLGVNHPDTLTTMNNLAITWKGLGRNTEAINLMEECVTGRTRILGANHHHTVGSHEALRQWQTEALEIGASAEEDPGP